MFTIQEILKISKNKKNCKTNVLHIPKMADSGTKK